jgi:hypothetical protein
MRVMILYTFEDSGIKYKPEPFPQHVPDDVGQRFVVEGKAKALDVVPDAPKKRRKIEH